MESDVSPNEGYLLIKHARYVLYWPQVRITSFEQLETEWGGQALVVPKQASPVTLYILSLHTGSLALVRLKNKIQTL